MVAALLALTWANSPWRAHYSSLWQIPIALRFATFIFERDLHFWINDGLMTIFFFVVGLEIRREIYSGELSELRRASLPIAAALGGMVFPALIYFSLNAGRSSATAWAVPMATDIAFAVGALALLGRRVMPALRILLLALAVIDDVGAIIVIALFYSTDIAASGFAVMGAGILGVFVMQLLGVRLALTYLVPGIVIWSGAYMAGIHPTLAGVIVGFMTPVRAWYGADEFLHQTETRVRFIRNEGFSNDRALLHHLQPLQVANREVVSPVERLQHALHGWIAFGIMPLFAFANAGVEIDTLQFHGDAGWVLAGVVLGLLLGKPIGIVAVSWLAVRFGLSVLPPGVRWSHISIVGLAGGIGFTMSLFIAQLAFPPGSMLEIAKVGILCGSGIAGVAALVIGSRILKPPHRGIASTAPKAENSTPCRSYISRENVENEKSGREDQGPELHQRG